MSSSNHGDNGIKRESETFDWNALLQKAEATLTDSAIVLNDTLTILKQARDLTSAAGLSIDSFIVEQQYQKVVPTAAVTTDAALEGDGSTGGIVVVTVPPTTGGFSNTDHIIPQTNDDEADRIANLKRNLIRRYRMVQPENRRENRWDKPKVVGERRRKIVLERDRDGSPPEPPNAGWTIFVGQMTIKFRHDEPNVHHSQCKGTIVKFFVG
jgi:hypothetical protein